MDLVHPPHCTCTSKAALRIHTGFHCTVNYVQKSCGTQGLKCWNTKGNATILYLHLGSQVSKSLALMSHCNSLQSPTYQSSQKPHSGSSILDTVVETLENNIEMTCIIHSIVSSIIPGYLIITNTF